MAEAPSASDAGERWLLPSLRSCANGSQGSEWRRWLGRGLRLSDVDAGPRLAVAGALSLTPAQVPWVRALAQQDLPDEWAGRAWLRLDRVTLQVDGFRLRLVALHDQPWSDHQWHSLQTCLRELPGTENWQLQPGQGGRSYLCVDGPLSDRTLPEGPGTPPPDALLRADLLESLPTARLWRQFLNDAQVALSPRDLTQAGHGVLQSEAPWLWGDAREEIEQCGLNWASVDDPELRALARYLRLNVGEGAGPRLREGATATPASIAKALKQGPLWLGFACGARWLLRPRDRWRWWTSAWTPVEPAG